MDPPDQEDLVRHPIVLRRLRVSRVADVGPRMRRITLAGEELGAFRRDGLDLPAFRTAAHDDHVKVFLAVPGATPVLPIQRGDHLDWPSDPRPLDREYTVRRFDPVAGELDLDILVHGAAPGAAWAAAARPGDVLHLGGPRASHLPPRTASEVHLIADLTGCPAIERWLEAPPIEAPVHVTLLAAPDEPWAAHGAASMTRLRDPMEATDLDRLPRPAADAYVWVAAEGSQVALIRAHLEAVGVPRSRVRASAYWWREGASVEE
ncbi:MAG: siderophore-interacting protein [Chloroflexi bacterium]|nr:siderophore-interacting protein [Chloroflexota bacterium]